MNQTQKRFIVLPRHGFYLTTAADTNELQPIIELKKVKTVRTMKCGALVVLTTDDIAASINLASRKFIVESDVLHFPSVRCVTSRRRRRGDASHPAFRFSDPLLQKAVDLSAAAIPLKCKVTGPENEPVEAAEVVLQSVVTGIAFKGKTNTKGIAEVNVIGKTFRILVFPHHGYWSKDGGRYDAENNDMAIIQLERLYAPGTYDWGHIAMEAHEVNKEFRGQGIKVGIIDTGIQADPPHEDLRVARGLNCVTGDFPDNQEKAPDSWKDDVDQHGSHCAGIVAALENEIGITGHAPQASLFGYKVFPIGMGASSADIADAIDFAIEDGVDVLNLSLGARTKSITVEQAIQRAFDAGIVCCCAAGNDNSTVSYPAALNLENVVSVAGIGKFGTYPSSSAHKLAETNKVSQDGQFFRYEKSNFGDVDGEPKVDVCAPAVAVTSTVKGGYARSNRRLALRWAYGKLEWHFNGSSPCHRHFSLNFALRRSRALLFAVLRSRSFKPLVECAVLTILQEVFGNHINSDTHHLRLASLDAVFLA